LFTIAITSRISSDPTRISYTKKAVKEADLIRILIRIVRIPAYTAEKELTSGRSSSSPTMALDHHNIFCRFFKNKTKILALSDYSELDIRQF
jgi:hypothetical protein